MRIDPFSAKGAVVSQLFKRVTYIPLETKRASIFGRIDKLLITGKRFIILDQTSNSVLFFGKDGKFQSKISKLPGSVKATGYEVLIEDIVYDHVANELIIMPASYQLHLAGKLFYFGENGEYLRSQLYEGINASAFTSLGNRRLIFMQDIPSESKSIESHNPYELLYVNDKKLIYRKLLPYDSSFYLPGEDKNSKVGFYTNDAGRDIFFSGYLEGRFFRLDSSGIKEVFNVVLPQSMTLPKDFRNNGSYDYKRLAFLEKNRNLVYGFENIYQINQWMLFDIQLMASEQEFKDNHLLYNHDNKMLFSFYRIRPDSASCFLPIYYYSSLFCDESNIYTSIPANQLVEAREQMNNQEIVFSRELEMFFRGINKFTNPIIVQLTPVQ